MVCGDNLAFWYIVLQDVVLKDERDCTVLNLVPKQMILVDKLWLLGPNKALAQVVYPAKGYVPREGSICGQLITRLNPMGGSVPEELVEREEQKTGQKLTVYNHQSNNHFNNQEFKLSPKHLNQGCRPYGVPCLVPRSYSCPLLSNKDVGGPLISPENRNERTPSEKKRSQQAPEYLDVDSSKISNQYRKDPLGRTPCHFLDSSLVAKESRSGGLEPAHSYCSTPTRRRLSDIPAACHCKKNDDSFEENKYVESWYREYQTQRSNQFCGQVNPNLVNPDARSNGVTELNNEKSHLTRMVLQSRNILIKRLVSIYHNNERCIQTDYREDKKETKELNNTVNADKICVTKPQDANMNVIPVCEHKYDWRQDTDRWVTVSALCHALEVICFTNERRVKSNHFQPNMVFHRPNVPNISLPAYLQRIAWYLRCSSACFVLALEYIHRLGHYCPEIEVNHKSVHGIVMTCIMVAMKFLDDKQFKNTFYARVAGLPVLNLAAFEVRLVFFLKFDLAVLPKQYNARYAAMVADNQGPGMVSIRPEVGMPATRVC